MSEPAAPSPVLRWLPGAWWATSGLVLLAGTAFLLRHVLDGGPDPLGVARLNQWHLAATAAQSALCALAAVVARRGALPAWSLLVAGALALTAGHEAWSWLFGELTSRGYGGTGG